MYQREDLTCLEKVESICRIAVYAGSQSRDMKERKRDSVTTCTKKHSSTGNSLQDFQRDGYSPKGSKQLSSMVA